MSVENSRLPFKSVGGALLFTVLLGPLGLLYASLRGMVDYTLKKGEFA